MRLIEVIVVILMGTQISEAWKRQNQQQLSDAFIKCAEKMNAPPGLRKQWQQFKYPRQDIAKAECFIRCFFQEIGFMEKSRVKPKRIHHQVEPFLSEKKNPKFMEHIEGCINEFKGHSCDKIFKVFLCLELGYKKEVQRALRASKTAVAAHTEL
ncbi:general odorant-binding protein 99a-like [Culicoides brevitarsis]|uniref:general odorant-binding protein 99a-like n=1 Tax=Culicoides brevitarsis TaxID=469753 RepID=UPI00307B21E7